MPSDHHHYQQQLQSAHFDCDCFFAAVEKRDRLDLHDKPVAVGGDSPRSVVAAACYVARIYGVRSAMPMMQAKKLCPNLVIIPHHFEKYRQAKQELKQILSRPKLPLKFDMLDEGFLNLKHYQGDKIALCADLQHMIRQDLYLTISFGLGPNSTMAKIICNLAKPSGLQAMSKAEIRDYMQDKSVALLPGVGPATAQRLQRAGITRISQLQLADEARLVQLFGKFGTNLKLMSLGNAPIRAYGQNINGQTINKSISVEQTFASDMRNRHELEEHILQFSHQLVRKLKGQSCYTVALKLRNHYFKNFNRNLTLTEPIFHAQQIADVGCYLLAEAMASNQTQDAYRLIGLGVSKFTDYKGSYSLFER